MEIVSQIGHRFKVETSEIKKVCFPPLFVFENIRTTDGQSSYRASVP